MQSPSSKQKPVEFFAADAEPAAAAASELPGEVASAFAAAEAAESAASLALSQSPAPMLPNAHKLAKGVGILMLSGVKDLYKL